MGRRGTGGGITAEMMVVASSAGRWSKVAPFLANRSGVQVNWTGTTNGAAVRVQGALSTTSTSVVNLVLRRSSQGTAFVASTVNQVISVIRVFSSAGVFNGTTKYAVVRFSAYP